MANDNFNEAISQKELMAGGTPMLLADYNRPFFDSVMQNQSGIGAQFKLGDISKASVGDSLGDKPMKIGNEYWWVFYNGQKMYGFKDVPKGKDKLPVPSRPVHELSQQGGKWVIGPRLAEATRQQVSENEYTYYVKDPLTEGGVFLGLPRAKEKPAAESGTSKQPKDEYKSLQFNQPDMLPQSELEYARALIAGQNKEQPFNFGRGALNAFAEGAAEAGSKKVMDAIDYQDWMGRQIPELERLRGETYRTKSPEKQAEMQNAYINLQKRKKELETSMKTPKIEKATSPASMTATGPKLEPNTADLTPQYQNILDEISKLEKGASTRGADDTYFAQVGSRPTPEMKLGVANKIYELARLAPFRGQDDSIKKMILAGQIKMEQLTLQHKYRLEEIQKKAELDPKGAANDYMGLLSELGYKPEEQPPTQTAAPAK